MATIMARVGAAALTVVALAAGCDDGSRSLEESAAIALCEGALERRTAAEVGLAASFRVQGVDLPLTQIATRLPAGSTVAKYYKGEVDRLQLIVSVASADVTKYCFKSLGLPMLRPPSAELMRRVREELAGTPTPTP